MNTSEQIDKLAPAMLAAQAEMPHALKAKTNAHFKNKYADIEAVIDAAKPVLAKCGLFFAHGCEPSDNPNCVTVTCRVTHESGQWIESSVTMSPQKCDPQGAGSAFTYGRRYTLQAVLGMASEDDDGNEGSRAPTPPQRATPPQPKAPDPRKALAAQIKEWSGVKTEDLGDAYRTVAKRMGIDSKLNDLTPEQTASMAEYVTKSSATAWADWLKESSK